MRSLIKTIREKINEERQEVREIREDKDDRSFDRYKYLFFCYMFNISLLLLLATGIVFLGRGTYNYISQVVSRLEDEANNRITDGSGSLKKTLSSGEEVEVSLEDGVLAVFVDGKEVGYPYPHANIFSSVKLDTDEGLLHLIMLDGSYAVMALT